MKCKFLYYRVTLHIRLRDRHGFTLINTDIIQLSPITNPLIHYNSNILIPGILQPDFPIT